MTVTNMEEETYTCFFYGTLMAFPILSRVIYGTQHPDPWQQDRLRVRPAILHDHCRHQVRGVDYPGVVAEAGCSVRGTVVEGLSKMDIDRLDSFEGDEYERQHVNVTILADDNVLDIHPDAKETDEVVRAGTYIWVQGNQHLENAEWDFDHFIKLKLRAWVGDSKNFDQESGASGPMGGSWWSRPDEVDAAAATDKPDTTLAPPQELKTNGVTE
ncbi:hypothetical protein ABW21_db0208425 [Orbilia brochopaga]|nr:hypothetical protein ABW21_db0208425 [Drechslerella brochopaga]